MSRHRSVRPRYGRIVLAALALFITAFAVLGGVDVVPTAPSAAEGDRPAKQTAPSGTAALVAADPEAAGIQPQVAGPAVPGVATGTHPPGDTAGDKDGGTAADPGRDEVVLPAGSGAGRRVVFSEAEQRVWLVRGDGTVRRTYLVSGSVEDNLEPGTYSVFSRSRWAVGLDDSGVMEFFVRFAHGERAAIGFHTIPTKLGVALQSRAELGTPRSHGCIRQAKADAISLWKFAPEGTPVVVV